MSYVNIQFGAAVATVEPSQVGVGCIIGATGNDVGLINNVTVSTLAVEDSELPSGTGDGQLQSSDTLYAAAEDYFLANPTGTLVLVGIGPGDNYAYANSAMSKVDDNNWNSQYAPVSSWNVLSDTLTSTIYFKVKLNADGVEDANTNKLGDTTYEEDVWYYVSENELIDEDDTLGNFGGSAGSSLQLDVENGVYTGGITFVEDEDGGEDFDVAIRIGEDEDEEDTYVSFSGIDKIVAKPHPEAFSYYMSDMIDHTVDFDAFAIGYDAAKSADDSNRYAATECPSGIGWYADLTYGAAMVSKLLGAGQRAVFFSEIPLAVDFGEDLDSYDAGNNGKTSDQIHEIIGSNELVTTFHSWQDTNGAVNQISSGIAGMGDFLKGSYRETMTFRSSNIPANAYPSNPVSSLWQDVRVNPFVQVRATGTTIWGSNLTHGVGTASNLNYVMCRNILANKIEEALYNLLFTRTLHIDLDSMERIKLAIRNVIEAYTGIYCDGFDSVSIPLEEYILNGNTTEINAAKAAKTVGNISVGFVWDGDVEYINITGLYGV